MPSRPSSARPEPTLLPSPSPASPSLAPRNHDNTRRKLRWDDAQGHEDELESGRQAEASAQGQLEEDEAGELQGGVLAITAAKGRIGCCFYDSVTDKLSFLEDQHDSAGWDLTSLSALSSSRTRSSSRVHDTLL